MATEAVYAGAMIEERQLLKSLRWYDGFVIALANPGFLLGALGGSIGVLGGWGAMVLWGVSMTLGVLQNWVYSEQAAMFPDKPGGISLYAHEGWRKYFTLVGPVATFGYWFAWSSVLASFGLLIGYIVQAEWYPSSATSAAWTFDTGPVTAGLPARLAAVLIVAVWLFNIFGVRPSLWVGYATGALMMIPLAVFIFLPFLTGDWQSSEHDVDRPELAGGVRVALAHGLVGVRRRGVRDVRSGVQGHGARHVARAAELRDLLARRLHPAAARARRNAAAGGDRGKSVRVLRARSSTSSSAVRPT